MDNPARWLLWPGQGRIHSKGNFPLINYHQGITSHISDIKRKIVQFLIWGQKGGNGGLQWW